MGMTAEDHFDSNGIGREILMAVAGRPEHQYGDSGDNAPARRCAAARKD